MNVNQVARIAALIGEPARTAMLLQLMDGRSMAATQLARTAGISAATASRHLALLVESELLQVTTLGRHRYYRIASGPVAALLESLMRIATTRDAGSRPVAPGPKDEYLRRARTCYDHLAGRLGVAITRRLADDRAVVLEADVGWVTNRAEASLRKIGVLLPAGLEAKSARPICRPCMDWSERRYHVAGQLGAIVCAHCLFRGWAVRRPESRALEIPPPGQAVFSNWLGLELWHFVTG
jgi:DNA-binding transcriptional ArsR family regulator